MRMKPGRQKLRLTRRRALAVLGAGVVLSGTAQFLRHALGDAAPRAYPAAPPPPADADIVDVVLTARERSLILDGKARPVWSYAADGSLPVIRLKRGQWLRATLRNELAEHTSIHWHGIRLPNALDGVPYLTQAPVLPGQSFTYAFRPPDTGTFFFHPHCDTVTQLGRGLAGVLIVDGDVPEPYDADLVCAYRDWHLAGDGGFAPFITDRGASRAGTFGTFGSVNDRALPLFQVPTQGDIRQRFLNLDMSRLIDLGVEGAEAWVIATDGNGLAPTQLDTWRLGPAMRLDLAFRAPAQAGARVRLMNYYAASPVPLAEFETVGPALQRPAFVPRALAAPSIPLPALDQAETFPLRLGTAAAPAEPGAAAPADIALPDGEVLRLADSLCLARRTFWALNGRPWPEGSADRTLPPPLAAFRRNRTYVIDIANATPHPHPLHLHGHTFQVLSSSQRRILPHFADTTLVLPKERLRIALVADNPGDWMVHCHIIEHQETGMMGYVHVA